MIFLLKSCCALDFAKNMSFIDIKILKLYQKIYML
jgi:hypothetical protein